VPYTIDKKKCKQSDGDSGTHVLSYTDGKGKDHDNCHTSKKGAQGQIAAIEGDNLAETDDMVFGGGGDPEAEGEADEDGEGFSESLLRSYIREKILREQRRSAKQGKLVKGYSNRSAGVSISQAPDVATGLSTDFLDYTFYITPGSYKVVEPTDIDQEYKYVLEPQQPGEKKALKMSATLPDSPITAISTSVKGAPFSSKVLNAKKRPISKLVFQVTGDDRFFVGAQSALEFELNSGAMTQQQKGLDYEKLTAAIAQGTRIPVNLGPGSEPMPPVQTLASAREGQKLYDDQGEQIGNMLMPPGLTKDSPYLDGLTDDEKQSAIKAAQIGASCAGVYQDQLAADTQAAGNTAASDLGVQTDIGPLTMELKLTAGATLTAFSPKMDISSEGVVTWRTTAEGGKSEGTSDKIYGSGTEYGKKWILELGTANTLAAGLMNVKLPANASWAIPKAQPTGAEFFKQLKLYLSDPANSGHGVKHTTTDQKITINGCDYKTNEVMAKAILNGGPSAKMVEVWPDASPYVDYYADKKDSYILIGDVAGGEPGMWSLGAAHPVYTAALALAGNPSIPNDFVGTGPCTLRFFFRPVSGGYTLYAQGQLKALDLNGTMETSASLPGYKDHQKWGSFSSLPDGDARQRMINLVALSIISCNQKADFEAFLKASGADPAKVWDMILTAYSSASKSGKEEESPKRLGKNPVMTEFQVRRFIKKQLLEDLSRADRTEISRIFKKEMEKSKIAKKIIKQEIEAQKKATQTMVDKSFKKNFDKELRAALGASFFGTPGKINKFVIDEIQAEVQKMLGDKATKEIVVQICKDVIIKLYRELSFSYPQVIQRIKV
jgi:hypothetical protein